MFSVVDVFVDVNAEHRFVDVIKACGPVHIEVHTTLAHPFTLTYKHRDRISKHIDEYDWFLYTEDDMTVPPAAMVAHMDMCKRTPRPCSVGFARIVKDTRGVLFFSDVRRPVKRCPAVGKHPCLVECDNAYSAVWMHDGEDTKQLLHHIPRSREQAASSFATRIPCNVLSSNAVVYHTTYSGKGYFKHRAGFHTLPVGNGSTHWACW